MKKFKRLTALALALVMVLGLTTGAGAAGAKYSSWFAPYYKEMQELGILPSSFTSGDLTATITRGEMCELAVVAFEKATGNVIDELERTDYFTDTTDKNILKAYEYGIVSGYPDGSFQPNKTLTRQEFFKIIQNFCEAAAYTSTRSKDLSAFADAGSIGSWAREAAQLCVSNAFVDGTKKYNSSLSRYGAEFNLRDHQNTGSNFAMADGHLETLSFGANPRGLVFAPLESWLRPVEDYWRPLWISGPPN